MAPIATPVGRPSPPARCKSAPIARAATCRRGRSRTTARALVNEAGNNSIAGPITLTSGGGDTRIRVDAGTLTLGGSVSPNVTNRNLILGGVASGFINGAITDGSSPNTLVSINKQDA